MVTFNEGWIMPTSATGMSLTYGEKRPWYKAGYHTGVDFTGAKGQAVVAAGDGKVVESGFNSSYGNYVKILHPGGIYTFYAHLAQRAVSVGNIVQSGFRLGTMGMTGNATGVHLHFEVRGGSGQYSDNIDPRGMLKTASASASMSPGVWQALFPGQAKPTSKGITAGPKTGGGLPGAAPGSTQVGGPGGGGGGGGGGSHTTIYEGGGAGGGGTVSEKPMTAQDYGFSSAFLAQYPELKALVDAAIREQWSNARLQGEVIDSEWYRARTDAQRKYDQESIADPKTWAESEKRMLDELTRLANIMGVDATNLEASAKEAVRNNLSANDYIGFLSTRASYSGEQVNRAGLIQQQIIEYGNDYGVTLGFDEMNRIMRDVLSKGGDWSESLAGYADVFRERAKAMYTGVAAQIDAGATVKEILDPYLAKASDMLGVPVQQMNTTTGKWNAAINGSRPLTMQEWEAEIRNNSTYRWDKGPQAMQWAKETGNEFLKVFGART